MIALRTSLFFIGWVGFTLLLGVCGLPLLFSRRAVWKLSSLWTKATLIWLRTTCGIRSELRGKLQGQLIACKHQSAWDTLMLWCVLGHPVFVLKRELYRIPIFGWYLRATGQIGIDRSSGREAMAQIETQARTLLAQGRVLVIFPEGTRVPVGKKKPYRGGIARLSKLLDLPVTPAALNAGQFWPKHSLLKKPGTAVLQFLKPMPACTGKQTPWMQQLEATIEQASAALLESH